MTDYSGLVLDVTASDATLDKDFLERIGHPVLVCHGPAWGRACPIIAGDCPMVDAAHGVIFQLDLDRPQHRVILRRYQEVLKEDVPIMVVVTREQEELYPELLIGVQVWYEPPTIAHLDGFAAQTEAADDLRV
ncbi:MAG: hypothetical protein BMS9Abin17_0566 [Acidimicrobiia bacterium]|nr:MAG: hypothetical protein BMS9Abin17_0566 [Acidimicrobiia bacterium]